MPDNGNMNFKNRFKDVIRTSLDECYKGVVGEFYLSKDEITQYVFFYLIAELKHKKSIQEKGTFSLNQIVKDKFKTEYNDKRVSNMLNKGLSTEFMDQVRKSDYDKMHEHWQHMNFKNMLKTAEINAMEIEAKNQGKTQTRHLERLNGYSIPEFQLPQLKVLEDLFFDSVYKRIRRKNINKISFKEYEEFVNKLEKDTCKYNSEDANISYYQLEKTMSFELLKSILRVINKTEPTEVDMAADCLTLTLLIPEIDNRQKYVEVYPDLSLHEITKWVREVYELSVIFIPRVILDSKMRINQLFNSGDDLLNLNPQEENEFKAIYSGRTYKNDFKIGVDFEEKDFKKIMGKLENFNKIVLDMDRK